MAGRVLLALWTAFLQVAAASEGIHAVEVLSDELSLLQQRAAVSGVKSGVLPVPLLQHGSTHAAEHRARAIPTLKVNLDLPPEERWVDAFGLERLREMASGDLGEVDWTLLRDVDFTPDEEFVAEMRGVLKYAGNPALTVEHLLEGEIGYERGFTACTGVIAATPNGTVFHGRNLDLDPAKRLEMERDTVDVTYYRGGKPLFSSTMFGFSVGVHTGYRIGSYSMAQNTRQGCGDMEPNIRAARRGARPFTLVMRRILQDEATYEEAVHKIAEIPLIAPQYFTVAGAGAWQGALVTRDRLGMTAPYANVEVLSPQINRWFIVQTNDDTWRPATDPRRPTALAKFSGLKPEDMNPDTLLDVMMTEPVLNDGTIFTWILEPSTGMRRVFIGSDELRGDIAVPALVSDIEVEAPPALALLKLKRAQNRR